uniref:Uncharacterized protein n=1 Tax=Cacopsylla melanoneura TaxID=428564 RepID=A0A8D8ZMV1_9HEMI
MLPRRNVATHLQDCNPLYSKQTGPVGNLYSQYIPRVMSSLDHSICLKCCQVVHCIEVSVLLNINFELGVNFARQECKQLPSMFHTVERVGEEWSSGSEKPTLSSLSRYTV